MHCSWMGVGVAYCAADRARCSAGTSELKAPFEKEGCRCEADRGLRARDTGACVLKLSYLVRRSTDLYPPDAWKRKDRKKITAFVRLRLVEERHGM